MSARTRRVPWLLAAAAAIVLAGLLARVEPEPGPGTGLALDRSPEPPPHGAEQGPATPAVSPTAGAAAGAATVLPGRWLRLDDAPVPLPATLSAVSTGDELLVWGGLAAAGRQGIALLDTERRTWRHPAAFPLEPRDDPALVWTGAEVLAWGGRSASGRTLSDGAAYDPATDRWRTLPAEGAPPPLRERVAVWTGSELIVWGGRHGPGSGVGPSTPAGAAFDPVSDRWRRLPPDRQRSIGAAGGAWLGDRLLVWGSRRHPYAGDPHGGDRFALVLRDERWHVTATPRLRWPALAAGVATDGGALLWGTVPTGSEAPAELTPAGALYDRVTATWQPLPGVPSLRRGVVHGLAAAWTGTEVVLVGGGHRPALALAYRPSAREWFDLDPPFGAGGAPKVAAVWTGEALLVWGPGAADGSGPGVWSWRPAS